MSTIQPNAPQFEHLLYDDHNHTSQQPPHNPYYPTLSNSNNIAYHHQSPPAYSDLATTTVPLTQLHANQAAHRHQYPRSMTNQSPTTVVMSHPTTDYMYRRRYEKVKKAKKFGCEILLVAIIIVVFTQATLYLYQKRTCTNYVITKFAPDFTIRYDHVKDFNLLCRALAVILFALGLLKYSVTGPCGCFISFLVGIVALIGTILAATACYLSFYTPCFVGFEETIKNIVKSAVAMIADKVPGPEEGIFMEKNVIQTIEHDPNGVYIFGLNLGVFILFISTFFASCN